MSERTNADTLEITYLYTEWFTDKIKCKCAEQDAFVNLCCVLEVNANMLTSALCSGTAWQIENWHIFLPSLWFFWYKAMISLTINGDFLNKLHFC